MSPFTLRFYVAQVIGFNLKKFARKKYCFLYLRKNLYKRSVQSTTVKIRPHQNTDKQPELSEVPNYQYDEIYPN